MSSDGRKSEERPSRKSSETQRKSGEVPSRKPSETNRKSGDVPSRKPSQNRKSDETPSRTASAARNSGGGGARPAGSNSFVHRASGEKASRKSSGSSNPSNPYALGPKFSSHHTGGIAVPAAVALGVENPSAFAYKPTRASKVNVSVRASKSSVSKPKRVSSGTPAAAKKSQVGVAAASPSKVDRLAKYKAHIPPPSKTGEKTGIDMLLTGLKITIPDSLPDILKQYAKAAMRTQPPDLLKWSGAYFRALANGEKLPVKDRLEDPVKSSKDGLSPGILRVFDQILGDRGASVKLPKNSIMTKWLAFGLKPEPMDKYLSDAGIDQNNSVEWDKLVAVLAKTVGENLTETMSILCDVLTDQEEGKESTMSYQKWWAMYTYLANLQGVSQSKIEAVNEFLLPISYEHEGTVGPRDFTTPKCPPLE